MKTIKLWDGVKVITSQKIRKFRSKDAMFKYLNMDGDAYKEARDAVNQRLYCFRRVDLTEAYGGHTVILECYTNEKKEK